MIYIDKVENLNGTVELSGAKNSALPIMVAACLCEKPVLLKNMPTELNDVKVMVQLLREIGVNVEVDSVNKTIAIFRNPKTILSSCVSDDGSKIRYSLLLMPLILSFSTFVKIPSPGGCKLGDRKYDIHLDTLSKMGAHMEDDGEFITGERKSMLHGADLLFHIATTSGSEAAVIAGCLADGKTTIRNANTRPEVIDLVEFLNYMGADINYNTRYIEVRGVKHLHGGEYSIMTDRHEAISYAILAGICRSEICIKNFDLRFVQEDGELLKKIGLNVFEWGGNVYVSAKNKELHPFSMATGAYPGINSDMQPLFAALALTIPGETIITDTRFTERFQYVDEFKKLGANLNNYENCVIIQGGTHLVGTEVIATDLRAGAALTFLGCYADGTTSVKNYYQTKRGYENIILKMRKLGCNITETRE